MSLLPHLRRRLGLLAGLLWLAGCSDPPVGPCCEPLQPAGLVVSDPGRAPSLVARAGSAGAGGTTVAYVSLSPGTVPGGSRASARRLGDVAALTTAVLDGGFDPVPISAQVGDSIDVRVTDAAGRTLLKAQLPVLAAHVPVVVRTYPPALKRDQPLNASIIVVFSEPVDGASITPPSVQLFRGTSVVAGTVGLLAGTGAAVAFTPAAPLIGNSDYRLVVTRGVKDLEGETLGAGFTVAFRTGQSSTGSATSIILSPDTLYATTGTTYQLTVNVRDGAGNELIDQPITWLSSDPTGLTVSATGLLTARANGHYDVSANVNGLQAVTEVIVTDAPASVEVVPASATVAVLDTVMLSATVRNAAGQVLVEYPPMTLVSSAPAVATVVPSSYGSGWATVTGVSPGSATITATTGAARGTASITVTPKRPVASVTITPSAASLVVQGTVQLTSTLLDAQGKVIEGRTITWASNNPAAATVDPSGLVTGVGAGSALVSATSEGVSGTAAITVTTVSFATLSAGGDQSCGVTMTGAAYCWGTVPIAVTGGLAFTAVTTGARHTCGLVTGGAAYCWGDNFYGQLGDGSTNSSPVPVAVTGGLTFTAVSAGGYHACGLTTSGAAYCWGDDGDGQLGDGSTISHSSVPVPVTGGLTFSTLTAGGLHTCGLTTSGAAYCWGLNIDGQLGDGTTTLRSVPQAVTGALTWSALSARMWHTCGLTTTGAAYCWGDNSDGQLGDGSTTSSSVPVAVTGGLTFSAVALGGMAVGGGLHTCGLTTTGAAYCWGASGYGQLGIGTGVGPDQCSSVSGTVPCSRKPVAVSGGLAFSAVTTGNLRTCGLTTNGVAYCWGQADLGDGSTSNSFTPVKVAGQP